VNRVTICFAATSNGIAVTAVTFLLHAMAYGVDIKITQQHYILPID
jgi:hypothetical protein